MNITEFRNTKIKDIDLLSTNIPTLQDNAGIDDIVKKISDNPHFVVITSREDPKKIEGVISASDLGKLNPTSDASSIMTRDVISVRSNQTIDEVSKIMKETGKKILPVINDRNEFAGVITTSKLRQQLANNIELEL